MADTGCQSYLASMKVICPSLSKNDLLPVTMCMHAANNNGIQILGAVLPRFSGRSNFRHTLQTTDPQTGPGVESDNGYSRNIASAHPLNPSAATKDGKYHWSAAALFM